MTLQELLERHARPATAGVPDWMLGCFRRRCISFASGESDNQTIVYWFQSRNTTIDLRLPVAEQQVPAKALNEYSPAELRRITDYEGWEARSQWDGELMSWFDETALQTHNRWPEPAELKRIGNCMIEFAPSGAYVEDWRAQPSEAGPLIGLRMIEQRNLDTGDCVHRGGGLIIAGDHAALVLGRPEPLSNDASLQEQLESASPDTIQRLFDFETSVAQGSITKGFTIHHTTRSARLGQPLLPDARSDWFVEDQEVRHRFEIEGVTHERRYLIDTLEAHCPFDLHTPWSSEAKAWFGREAATLTRYTQVLN
ncbi:hypothetical protein EDC38_2017 [Marinimicrobium koreense]|uniref:Uncharacterized protein n=1 Tax=Marinimicrobium koreense TaxID=306545 RepID=A0A3N1NYX1_9GAMM|nr:hypothetical protein [Marinimicrobium koreense]ROQ21393.1 hypothetical protein EDC38_2017 [Marinimicrobium koreense]